MSDGPSDLGARALAEILVLTGLCLIGIIIFSAIGLGLASLYLGVKMEEIQNMMDLQSFSSNGRVALLVLQGTISLGGFVAFPWLIKYLQPSSPFRVSFSLIPNATILLLVVGLAVLMMPVNGWLASWNETIHLPSFLEGFQQWAKAKELEMEGLTLFLVRFSSPLEVFLGFVVIALIAGFSEEYFFRKMLQPRIFGLVGNIHLAIWLTAFIFSAIHMQFYGLFPRMALGALFGYYYYWTGNIWISVFGHSLNNAITLVGMYLYQQNISPIDVEDPKVIPWYIGAVAAGITWSLASMIQEEAVQIKSQRINRVQPETNVPQ